MADQAKTSDEASQPLVSPQPEESKQTEPEAPADSKQTKAPQPNVGIQNEDDGDEADERLLEPEPRVRPVPLAAYHNRPGQSYRLKIALTILYIGLVFIVLALIAGIVRAIVSRFKPKPPPTISSSIEFGSPDSILTSEYPNDDKLPGILETYGRDGYVLTEVYGPSDQYPLQGMKLAFENGFETHTLKVGEHMQYLSPTSVPAGKTISKVSVYESILQGPTPPLYYICGLVFQDESDNVFLDKQWSVLPPCNEAKLSEPKTIPQGKSIIGISVSDTDKRTAFITKMAFYLWSPP